MYIVYLVFRARVGCPGRVGDRKATRSGSAARRVLTHLCNNPNDTLKAFNKVKALKSLQIVRHHPTPVILGYPCSFSSSDLNLSVVNVLLLYVHTHTTCIQQLTLHSQHVNAGDQQLYADDCTWKKPVEQKVRTAVTPLHLSQAADSSLSHNSKPLNCAVCSP